MTEQVYFIFSAPVGIECASRKILAVAGMTASLGMLLAVIRAGAGKLCVQLAGSVESP